MRKRKEHYNINRMSEENSKKVEITSRVQRQQVLVDDSRYKKFMCKDCLNFNGECKKGRQASICAEKGLKNK